MANPLNRNSLQGWLNRRVPNAPVWCSAGSLLACRWDVDERAGQAGRGRAVMLCHAEAVTHIYFVYELFPPHALRSALRTHALRITSHGHAHRASSELHALTRTHAFLCLSLLFCCYAMLHGLVFSTLVQP
jgi:hypothetical protein